MCFSAAASFAGGTVLTGIGIATLRRNHLPSRRLFVAIPLIFGVQQLSEGVVWLTLQSPGHDRILMAATNVFLFAALIAWPALVPYAMYRMEENAGRHESLRRLMAVGVAVMLLHGYGLATYPATARISAFHIQYGLAAPSWLIYAGSLGYVVATILPLFISSVRRVYLFGLVILFSYIATIFFYREYLTSVWCFFAAIASSIIWWIIREPSLSDDSRLIHPV